MQKVGFTYPGTDRRVLRDVTLRCTLNSRIAVLGVRSAPTCSVSTMDTAGRFEMTLGLCLCQPFR
jgi:ABC-type transport system involved in cytochrome bd biosynthesis fused ATPase/permease subunit